MAQRDRHHHVVHLRHMDNVGLRRPLSSLRRMLERGDRESEGECVDGGDGRDVGVVLDARDCVYSARYTRGDRQ